MKKIVAIILFVLFASILLSCTSSSTPAPAPTPAPTPTLTPTPAPTPARKQSPPKAIARPIQVTGTTGKSYYLSGEDIDIKISFERDPQHKEPLEINPFPPAITVKLRQDDESVRSFPAGTATRRLEPGEVVNYDLTWNQRDDQGQPVHYGYYYLSFGSIAYGEAGRMGILSLCPFPILPAEGALEKTIEVNQSQTVNGITIKLERVELSNLGMSVSVFTIPPDPILPNPTDTEGILEEVAIPPSSEGAPTLPKGPSVTPPTPSPLTFYITAEYRLDGGAIQAVLITEGSRSVVSLENGVECTWKKLGPVPKSAELLTFTITELNGWEGPWEFRIPLE